MTTMHRARAIAAAMTSLLLALPAAAQAQTAVITGKVTSEFGQPVEQANVYINDLTISVATNAQGVYTITIPAARVSGQAGQPARSRDRLSAGIAADPPHGGKPDPELHVEAGRQSPQRSRRHGRRRRGTERAKVPFAIGRLTAEDMPVPALDPIQALAGQGCRRPYRADRAARPGTTPEIMLRGPHVDQRAGPQPRSAVRRRRRDPERRQPRRAGRSRHRVRRSREGRGRRVALRRDGGQRRHRHQDEARREPGRRQVQRPHGIRRERLNSFNYGAAGQPSRCSSTRRATRFCVSGAGPVAPCSRTVELDDGDAAHQQRRRGHDSHRLQTFSGRAQPSGGELLNVFQSNMWPGQCYNIARRRSRRQASIALQLARCDRASRRRALLRQRLVHGRPGRHQGAHRSAAAPRPREPRLRRRAATATVSVSTLYDQWHARTFTPATSARCCRGATTGTDYSRATRWAAAPHVGGTGLRPTTQRRRRASSTIPRTRSTTASPTASSAT